MNGRQRSVGVWALEARWAVLASCRGEIIAPSVARPDVGVVPEMAGALVQRGVAR
jgi:hypothetical protein